MNKLLGVEDLETVLLCYTSGLSRKQKIRMLELAGHKMSKAIEKGNQPAIDHLHGNMWMLKNMIDMDVLE